MKFLPLLAGSILLSFVVIGCETSSTGGTSGGRVIMYPTVDQMARLEREWGVEPRQVRARGDYPELNYASQQDANPAPRAAQTAPPQPNMLAPAPEPVLDSATGQPTVDPATMQKLR